MNTKASFILVIISLLIFSVVYTGCLSNVPLVRDVSPSLKSTSLDETRELAIGDTAIISGPQGNLEVSVRAFNVTTGDILIEEKNIGTDTIQYNPTLWLQDGDGINYTTIYCHADICPSYVFFTTLPPQFTEKRDLDFHLPESGLHAKLVLYWSGLGQVASWNLIPA